MFLYLLDESEGKAFMELAIQAMKVNKVDFVFNEAEYETYLSELNLQDFTPKGISFEAAAAMFRNSKTSVKRSVIIELCCMIFADTKSIEAKWIYSLSELFHIKKEETDRLVRWSRDFSDFLKIGLMYINAK